LTVVEAMLAGKPVVVTPAGSFKEIIKDGETGIITKTFSTKSLAESIEKVLDDAELFKKISSNAKKDAEKRFSLKLWIKQTENTFLEVAK